uniref:Peptidase M23B n=1 Tax=Magnetococcus massalia (strain MO-1) TaxID=451514 RepID=A0A1S7LPB4_MAGMO|nr:Peptidase M23B [Candidatus Magnetococcus massalia]
MNPGYNNKLKKLRTISHNGRGYLAPKARSDRRWLRFVMVGVLTVSGLVAHRVLDAHTGNMQGKHAATQEDAQRFQDAMALKRAGLLPTQSHALDNEPKQRALYLPDTMAEEAPLDVVMTPSTLDVPAADIPDVHKQLEGRPLPKELNSEVMRVAATRLFKDVVQPGDSLTTLLARFDVPYRDAVRIGQLSTKVYDFSRKLRPGHEIAVRRDRQESLRGVYYAVSRQKTLVLHTNDSKKYSIKLTNRPLDLAVLEPLRHVEKKVAKKQIAPQLKNSVHMSPGLAALYADMEQTEGAENFAPMALTKVVPSPLMVGEQLQVKRELEAVTAQQAVQAPKKWLASRVVLKPVERRTTLKPVGQSSIRPVASITPPTIISPIAKRHRFRTNQDLVNRYFSSAKQVVEEKVRRGDMFSAILARHGVSNLVAFELAKVAKSKSKFDIARRLRPGQTMQLIFGERKKLVGLTYSAGSDRTLVIKQQAGNRFASHFETKDYVRKVRTVSTTINDSLLLAARKAKLSQNLAMRLAGLFEWDVDFARDIRAGDKFSVVFEELYQDGKKVRTGKILAAKFINQGNDYHAIRYTDPKGNTGYYDLNGRNVEKMFIRAPVDFKRISSRFSLARKHPVFGFTRAHKGTDYAAPTGTPVRASGNGRIAHVGRKGSFGKLILVRHNSTYTTAYAHLNSYKRGLKVGQRVKQGETIGFVGQTGAATGPHLHYEVRVRGRQVNPLTVKLPSAQSVPRRYKQHFKRTSRALVAMLDNAPTMVAAVSKEKKNHTR